jgi:hypothetical protein
VTGHQWLYSPLLDPGLFFSFGNIFTQTAILLGRVISPSQGRYLHIGQHKHKTNTYTDIHALSGIRIHDPSVRAKTIHALHRGATVIGSYLVNKLKKKEGSLTFISTEQ